MCGERCDVKCHKNASKLSYILDINYLGFLFTRFLFNKIIFFKWYLPLFLFCFSLKLWYVKVRRKVIISDGKCNGKCHKTFQKNILQIFFDICFFFLHLFLAFQKGLNKKTLYYIPT